MRRRSILSCEPRAAGRMMSMALVFLLAATAGEAAYVITMQNQRVEGTDIRAKQDGSIILQTPQGSRTFYKGQYLRAVADKPENYDKALALAQAGKFDEAVALLEAVVRDYRFLEWDNQARKALPQIYEGKGDFAAAAAAYEELFKLIPKSDVTPELEWALRDSLFKAKEFAKLEPLLDTVIAGANREDAARAQIMRGDIRRAQGQLEPAALDYLRTMVLFKSERTHQPEATFKAAQVLEELRDRRAKDLFKTVVEDYPASPYAAEARKKM